MMKLRQQSGSVFILAIVLVSAWLPVNISAQTAAFVALSGSTTNAAYSYDGIHWLACPYGTPFNNGGISVAYSGGVFTAISASSDTNAAYSYDGITWTASPTGLPKTQGNWQGVADTGGYFTAISYQDGLLAYSTDGESWTNLYGPMMTSPVYLMGDCWSIASGMCGGTLTIIVTSVADNAYSFNRSPPDGLWQAWTLPQTSEWVVAYGNQEFVAVGPGTNAYTTNAVNWHSAHSVSGNWTSIAFGNGTFIATQGGSSTAEYTTNPPSGWTSCSLPVSDNWAGLAWNSNLFVAIANGSTNAAYSSNGINWTLSPTGLPVSDNWAAVTAGPPLSLPVITNEPENIATLPAFSPTFSVGAASSYALGYQWFFNGTNIAGATNSAYTLTNVQATDVGSYTVVVTNIYGSVTSSVATLTLNGYITNGLVAYWRMADQSGATATDWSGNGLNLPLSNSPSWGSNYLTLNGSTQYGDAGSNALTSLDTNDMTICAWINQNDNSIRGIVDKSYYISCSNYGGWSLYVNAGQLNWTVEDCNGGSMADSGPMSVTPGQWTFITVVWHHPTGESNYVSYYINGIQNSTVGAGAQSENLSGLAHLEVGSYESGTLLFNGSMRDFAIYNHALSPAEVGSNYLATALTTNVQTPDLLYYTMNFYGATNDYQTITNYAMGQPNGLIIESNSASTNKPVVWTNGVGTVSNSLHFSGVYTYIDTSNSFNFTNNTFTINLWFSPYNEGAIIMANDTFDVNGWYLRLVHNNTSIEFGAETNATDYSIQTTGGVGNWPGHDPVISNTNWDMLTVTGDGVNPPLFYVNGSLMPTTTIGFAYPAPTSNHLLIGYGYDGDPGGPVDLDGDIWRVQIWSRNLSQADIATLFFDQLFGYFMPLESPLEP